MISNHHFFVGKGSDRQKIGSGLELKKIGKNLFPKNEVAYFFPVVVAGFEPTISKSAAECSTTVPLTLFS
jgi:hypothetical protein